MRGQSAPGNPGTQRRVCTETLGGSLLKGKVTCPVGRRGVGSHRGLQIQRSIRRGILFRLVTGRPTACSSFASSRVLPECPAPHATRSAVPGHYTASLRRRIHQLLTVRSATPLWKIPSALGRSLFQRFTYHHLEPNTVAVRLTKYAQFAAG